MKAEVRPAVLMMVKDDDDIFIKALEHWASIGVSAFYIAETNEKQKIALEVWQIEEDLNLNVHYWHKITDKFDGHQIINFLKGHAISDGYNCLFPADADEFLCLGPYRTVIEWVNLVPLGDYWWCEVPYLNHWPGGGATWQDPQGKAILGRAHIGMDISIGNHVVTNTGGWGKAATLGVHYDHYPFRSKEQMVQKITSHGSAFINMGLHDHHYPTLYRDMQAGGQAWIDAHWKELCERGIDKEIQPPKWL